MCFMFDLPIYTFQKTINYVYYVYCPTTIKLCAVLYERRRITVFCCPRSVGAGAADWSSLIGRRHATPLCVCVCVWVAYAGGTVLRVLHTRRAEQVYSTLNTHSMSVTRRTHCDAIIV